MACAPNAEDDETLDELTIAYIHRKLELQDPEEARLEGITQLVQTAKEKASLSKQYLEQSHESVNKILERLHTFTQAPTGWFMDLCSRQDEIVLQLHKTFNADDSCDEVRTAAEEVLLLHLCVDELHVPPRLIVREIQARKDATSSTGELASLPSTISRSEVSEMGSAVVTEIKEKSQASGTAFHPTRKESNSSAPETTSSGKELTLSSSSGGAETISETLQASATSLSSHPPASLASSASSKFFLPKNTLEQQRFQSDVSSCTCGKWLMSSASEISVQTGDVRYYHETKKESPASVQVTKDTRSRSHNRKISSYSVCTELAPDQTLAPCSSRNLIKKQSTFRGEAVKRIKSRCDLAATASRHSMCSTSVPSSTTTGQWERHCHSTISFHDPFSDVASEISRLGTASSSLSLPQLDPLRFSSLQLPDLILGKDQSHNAIRQHASVTLATSHQQLPKANYIEILEKKGETNEKKTKVLDSFEQLHVDAEMSESRNDARFHAFEEHPNRCSEQNPRVLQHQANVRNNELETAATHVTESSAARRKNTSKTKLRYSVEKVVDLRIIRVSKEALMPERNERRVLISGHYQRKDNQLPLRFMLFLYMEEKSQAEALNQNQQVKEGNKGTSSSPNKTVLCGSYVRDMLTSGKRLRWRFRQPAEETWGVIL